MARTKREKVFISYSHKDAAWMERLRVHLEPLEREGLLDFWFDEDIEPGDDWFAKIKQAIAETRVAVLLISPNFLASEFIAQHELPPLLKAAGQGKLRILPLYLASSNVGAMNDIAAFQGINDPAQPLASLSEADQDKALVDASTAIRNALGTAPWKQKTFLLRRVLPMIALFIVVAVAGTYFLTPVIEERSTKAVVIIPGLDVRNVLPDVDGTVSSPRILDIEIPGPDVTVDTMFRRIYVVGGKAGVLERVYRKNEDVWQGAVRTYLNNSGAIPPEQLDVAIDQVMSLELAFIESPKLKAGDAVTVSLLEEEGNETRTQISQPLTIQESPVTTHILVFDP
ncbi:MAG: TIR domain-containing protein [Rhodothermaceae bacterium]|nr:TIR domain-containing protein [Rhodothermaceae bacterium]